MIRNRATYSPLLIFLCILVAACGNDPQFEDVTLPEWDSEERIYRIQTDETGIYAANESDLFFYPFSGETGWTALGLSRSFDGFNSVRDFLLLGNWSIITAVDGDIPLWESNDFGENWHPLGNNLELNMVNNLANVPGWGYGLLYAISSGQVAGSGNGDTWTILLENGSGAFLRINPYNPSQLWALGSTVIGQKYMARSLDTGDSWENIDTPLQANMAWDIVFNSSEPNTMLLATTGNVNISRSDDSGDTWDPVYQDNQINTLANSLAEPDRVYAAGWKQSGKLTLLVSNDFGITWELIEQDHGSELITVNDIAVSLIDGVETLFLATNEHGVFRYSEGVFAAVD